MFIQFRVGNYRSFKDPVTFSMAATSLVSQDKVLDDNTIFPAGEHLRLLTSAAVYGANASGKSNLAAAMRFMKQLVEGSLQPQASKRIEVDVFALSDVTVQQPSLFEIAFQYANVQYRYGFEVTTERVTAEWLYARPNKREVCLFERDGGAIDCSPRHFKEGIGLEDKTRANVLFLSVAAAFNGPIAQQILQWFAQFSVASGINDTHLRDFTLKALEDKELSRGIARFIGSLDVNIEDLIIQDSDELFRSALFDNKERDTRELSEYLEMLIKISFIRLHAISPESGIFTKHRRFNAEGKPTGVELFTFELHESEGSKRLFALAGPILDALQHGKVLVIDEFDARLHPLVSCELIRYFNSKETNPHHAQLIFMTHDTNLLDRQRLRRDQIWFTEKDRYGATSLYSLAEFRVRNDALYERDYIAGKYGAIPFLGGANRVNEDANAEEVVQTPGKAVV